MSFVPKGQTGSNANLTGQRTNLITVLNNGGRGAVLFRLAVDNAGGNPINNRPFIDAEYNRPLCHHTILRLS